MTLRDKVLKLVLKRLKRKYGVTQVCIDDLPDLVKTLKEKSRRKK